MGIQIFFKTRFSKSVSKIDLRLKNGSWLILTKKTSKTSKMALIRLISIESFLVEFFFLNQHQNLSKIEGQARTAQNYKRSSLNIHRFKNYKILKEPCQEIHKLPIN